MTYKEWNDLKRHGYAGTGTPSHPEQSGYWVMVGSPEGTLLVTSPTVAGLLMWDYRRSSQ